MKAATALETVGFNLEQARRRVQERDELIKLKGEALTRRWVEALESGASEPGLTSEGEELEALTFENERERTLIPALERRLEQLLHECIYEDYSELPAKLDAIAEESNATLEAAEALVFGANGKPGKSAKDLASAGLVATLRRLRELDGRWDEVHARYTEARDAYEAGAVFPEAEISPRELVIDAAKRGEAQKRLRLGNQRAMEESAARLWAARLIVRKTEEVPGYCPTWGPPDFTEGAPGWLLEALVAARSAGTDRTITVKVLDPEYPPIHWAPRDRTARHIPRKAGSRELLSWFCDQGPGKSRLRTARQESSERRSMAEAEARVAARGAEEQQPADVVTEAQ